MPAPEELLSAGAMLSLDQELRNDRTADTVSARVYRHPALRDQPVVRLTADNLAAGDDLTMEFLGFEAPTVIGPIARRQRQALGFPGWAIINDPKHARYALELVKEFKKAVRRSKAKPGHGHDAFVEIAKRLGKSVAHFLPSFWEQVGREFIALDNATYASRAFGKAREAEKVHALKVDESLRRESFLEFALAGAVSIKALTEYGKDLAATLEPVDAWTFFRELCVRRTLGGMPPWSSMIKDITPLIKAAKLDVVEETQKILAEMIDSPAIARSSFAFWESASKAITGLVAENARVAGVLLNLIPQTSAWQNENCRWLDMLKSWGILSNAWQDGVASEAGPRGGTAAWLNRLLLQCGAMTQVLFDAVVEMQERLRNDAAPVIPYQKPRWGYYVDVNVDLLDLLLELKIPVADPPEKLLIKLKDWATVADKGAKNRPRDPVSLVADARFAKKFDEALQEAVGEATFEAAATGKAAMRDARHAWLLRQISGVSAFGLPDSETFIDRIEARASRVMFQEFPDAITALENASIVEPLTRTLQCGLIDEYGWPVLEQVFAEFTAGGATSPLTLGQFPYIIVTDRLKAVVVRGSQVVHRAELKIPAGHKLKQIMFVDGDLLLWTGKTHEASCFWNSDPQLMDAGFLFWDAGLTGTVVDVADGGTLVGQKIVHRGDKTPPPSDIRDEVFSDGKHWWQKTWEYDAAAEGSELRLQELDASTGQLGRKSLPSWFDDYVTEGWTLDLKDCSLLPIGHYFPTSPLGTANGLLGFRVRSKDKRLRIEGIDGRSGEFETDRDFSALLNQPGTENYLPVEMENDYRGWKCYRLCSPDGSFVGSEIRSGIGAYNRGQLFSPPAAYLHAFEPRDLAGSAKLRKITTADVQKLLDAENRDVDNFKAGTGNSKPGSIIDQIRTGNVSAGTSRVISENEHYSQLDAAIQEFLGAASNLRLRIGIRGIVVRAGNKARALATMIEKRKSAPVATVVANVHEADASIETFIRGLAYGFRAIPGKSFVESLGELARFFKGTVDLVFFPGPWLNILPNLVNCLAEKVWQRFCREPEEKSWRAFAEVWCQTGMADLPGCFRRYSGTTTQADFLATEIAAVESQTTLVSRVGYETNLVIPVAFKGNRYIVMKTPTQYEVLEYAPTGAFQTLDGMTMVSNTVHEYSESLWNAKQWKSFLACTAEQGLRIPAPAFFAGLAESLHSSVAEVVIVWFGLPNVDSYQSNFMPAHLRDACKLKTKECSAAKESLKALPEARRMELVRSIIGGEPKELWEETPSTAAERLKTVWLSDKQRLPLSAEWIEKLCDAFDYGPNKNRVLQAMNAPLQDPIFRSEHRWTVRVRAGGYSREILPETDTDYFDGMMLRGSLIGMLMLAYGLPVGEPARLKMPDLHAACLNALDSPTLILNAGYAYHYSEKDPDFTSKVVESLVARPTHMDSVLSADDGTIWVIIEGHQVFVGVRPSKIRSKAESVKVDGQMHGLFKDQLANLPTFGDLSAIMMIRQIQLLRSEGVAALVRRIQGTPVPVGEFECNPMYSAPTTVTAVAKKHKLSEAAAVWYLQLLTLADPTDKNVQQWNHWTSATQKATAKELLDRGLVIEASRSRAGRKLFLPGGWEDLKSPHLPIETWKLPLFRMAREITGKATPPLSRILPLEPVHQLFERAWQRVESGDVPKYEEVR